MSIFDKAYDEMTMFQVCSRLPGELAISAVKRRILNINSVLSFVTSCGNDVIKVKEVFDHVNNVIANSEVDETLDVFKDSQPLLFAWLNDSNSKRIKSVGIDKLSTKFRFNLASSSDEQELIGILNKVIVEDSVSAEFNSSRIRSVLGKADTEVFQKLADIVLSSDRPDIRETLLGVSNYANTKTLTNNQLIIALKAFANNTNKSSMGSIGMLDYRLFSELRPMERLNALERYMQGIPKYHKLSLFSPMPTIEEFKYSLFSCSVEHYDRVNNLVNTFMDITSLDPPVNDTDDDQ